MNTMTLDKAIDTVSQLPFEQQEILVEILRRRHIETRRREMALDAQESLALFHEGRLVAETADTVIEQLHLSAIGSRDEVY